MKAGGGASHSHSANSISFNQPNQFHSTLLMNWWLMKKWMKLNEGMSAVSPGWLCPKKTNKQIHFQLNLIWFVFVGRPATIRQKKSINQSINQINQIFNLNWWLMIVDDFVGADRPPREAHQFIHFIHKLKRSLGPQSSSILSLFLWIAHSQRAIQKEIKRIEWAAARNQTVPFLQLLISLSFHYHSMKFHQLLKYFHCLIPLITVIILLFSFFPFHKVKWKQIK